MPFKECSHQKVPGFNFSYFPSPNTVSKNNKDFIEEKFLKEVIFLVTWIFIKQLNKENGIG